MSRFSRHFSVAVAILGGFLYGYHTAVIAGVLILVAPLFDLTLFEQGMLVSAILIGALPGALLASQLADRLGRKRSLLITAFLFVIGTALTAIAHSYSALIIGRLINGVALGLVSVVTPLYIAEISRPEHRGGTVSLYQFALTLGIMAAFIAGYLYSPAQNWRMMFAAGAIPAILQLIFLPMIAETPHWLQHKGQLQRSEGSLWKAFGKVKSRYVIIVGLVLCIFQQITGINTVIYYAPVIFQSAGFASEHGALLATLGIGVINVIATVFSVLYLDKRGRRFFLLISSGAMMISLLVFSLSSHFINGWGNQISAISLMAYVASFAIGLGPVMWVVISEIYPLHLRAKAMTLSIFANWSCNALVSWTFPDLLAKLGAQTSFLLYAAISALCFVFIYRYIPETKGKTFEEVEALMEKASRRQ